MVELSLEETQRIVSTLEQVARSRMIEIPISRVVKIRYIPTGTQFKALVASEEFTQEQFSASEGNLVYVEGSSRGGNLGLLYKIPKSPSKELPNSIYSDGQYERDTATREITKIFLPIDKVLPCSYHSTLMNLLQNPNIQQVTKA